MRSGGNHVEAISGKWTDPGSGNWISWRFINQTSAINRPLTGSEAEDDGCWCIIVWHVVDEIPAKDIINPDSRYGINCLSPFSKA
jgi:hypothetical protein